MERLTYQITPKTPEEREQIKQLLEKLSSTSVQIITDIGRATSFIVRTWTQEQSGKLAVEFSPAVAGPIAKAVASGQPYRSILQTLQSDPAALL